MCSYILASLKLRLALVHVSVKSFFRVLRLEELLLQFSFECECRLKRDLRTRLHRTLDATHGVRGFVWSGELARVIMNHLGKAFAGFSFEHLIQNTKLQPALEIEQLSGDHQLNRFRLANNSHQTLCAASPRQHTECDFRQS